MSDNTHVGHEDERLLAEWLGDLPAPSAGNEEPALAALDALLGDGPPQAALEAMRGSLDAWWAGQSGLVYYDWLDSPIGRVYAAASDQGVVSVDFGLPDEAAFLRHLEEAHFAGRQEKAVRSPERLAEITGQLAEYFRGQRDHFDFPVDLSALTPFQRQVLSATRQIQAGHVVTYKDIAERIGKPGASRAVGNALGRNPVPIVIPCHRVLPRDGSLGGYSGGGGSRTKARLLALEGVLPGKSGLYATS